jgi:hypothetical protein
MEGEIKYRLAGGEYLWCDDLPAPIDFRRSTYITRKRLIAGKTDRQKEVEILLWVAASRSVRVMR